jgi:hypothetical protein
MTDTNRPATNYGRLVSGVLAVVAVVLLFGAVIGTAGAKFLVQDLAYLGTGGLAGLACLAVAGAVHVSSRSSRRCEDLDRLL